MKAVVMAGGSGTRLRPLTINRPKPMVPMVNKPVIAHILDLLKRHGITDVVITLQYMADAIQDYFGDGSAYGMHIEYSIEESPLGTAGSVKQAQQFLDETFIVISGDAVTDIDLSALVEYHRNQQALATITLYRVANPLEYGVVIMDENGRVRQFQKSRVGARSSRIRSTPASMYWSPRCWTISSRGSALTLARTCSRSCWRNKIPCTGTWPRGTGVTSAIWQSISGPAATFSRVRCMWRTWASGCGPRYGPKRA